MPRPKIYAHRGASAYAPENTMPAFELACEMGADAFELDVHLTKDGKAVVIHDDTVDRTGDGSGAVESMTYEELSGLDFSNGMEDFSGVKIPLLEEVFGLAYRKSVFVNVEIKENRLQNSYPILDRVLEIEKRCGMFGNVIYSSFNHYLLRELKKISESIPIGILYLGGLVDVWEYAEKLGAQAVHPYYACLGDSALAPECHRRHIAVNAWTVNDEADILAAIRAGADGIISNRPDAVGETIRRFAEGVPQKVKKE